MTDVLGETKSGMEDAIAHLKEELKNIRTGRASPAMLDSVVVEVYGTQMKLRELASITVPEPRQLLINPYDVNNASLIGKAIEKANLGMQPIVDANGVRLNIPTMDEAARKEMCKLAHRKSEESKIAIRDWRRKANDDLKAKKTSSEITEDDQKRLEKETQTLTDK